MTRSHLNLAVVLSAAPLLAAPVPVDKEAKRKELETLWAELYKDEPAASTALLKLFKQPEHAVPFLKEKLKPLKLDQNRCQELIKDLGSDDEKVWKAAWEELDYFDPRLAIGLQDLMTQVTQNPARTRLVELMSNRKADSIAGHEIQLRPVGNDGFNFLAPKMGSWWAEHQIERLGRSMWNPKWSWVRAARGVAILEQLGTPDAVRALEQIAEGHDDAFPTKGAKASIERIRKK